MCSKQRQAFHVGNLGILFSENADLYIKTLYCRCVFVVACAWLYAKNKFKDGKGTTKNSIGQTLQTAKS